MPATPEQIHKAVAEAKSSLQRGNIARADFICRSVYAQGLRPLGIVLIEGQVAAAIGEFATARRRFEEVLASSPADPLVVNTLSQLAWLEAERNALAATAASGPHEQFHLIKSWGNGFTADVDHTLGHLLLAEMTGRTPVIHWGENSLFRDEGVENAWLEFFEPVTGISIRDLGRDEYAFFPPKWNARNLHCEEMNKMDGPGSRTAGILFLNQSANVTVGDFFTGVIELLPWVRGPHPLALDGPINAPAIEAAYRYLVERYLKPRAEIIAKVDLFAYQNFRGGEFVAVHVRGSDKIAEASGLAGAHRMVFEEVKSQLASRPGLSIFLMTDDVAVREQYMSSFPGRVITTDCVRTDSVTGVHYLAGGSRRKLGIEILTDVYLAARCERLVALGFTNVSNLILHLKQWPEGSTRLCGPIVHYRQNVKLHTFPETA
jgi:protein O-GlcNAc transferase